MSTFKFSQRSRTNMVGLHPALNTVLHAAIRETPYDFIVVQGLRSEAEQRKLIAAKKSWTMNSRHLTGHAFDFVALDERGKVTWDPRYYKEIWKAISDVAVRRGIDLTWGGSWKVGDFGHVQLSWKSYPLEGQKPKTAKNSKTVAAGVASGASASAQPLIGQLQEAGYIAQGLGEIGQWIAIALSLGLAAFIIYERTQKMERDGV